MIKRTDSEVIIFGVYYCLYSLFTYCFSSIIDEAFIFFSLFMISFSRAKMLKIPVYSLRLIAIFVLMIIWSTELHSLFVNYIMMITFFIFVRPTSSNVFFLKKILYVTAKVNAVLVIIQFLIPTPFIWLASKLYPESIAYAVEKTILSGYNLGMNCEVAFTALYISLGLIIAFSNKSKNIVDILLLFLALLLTNKRSCLIYLLVCSFFVYILSAKRSKKIDRVFMAIFGALFGCLSLYVLTILLPDVEMLKRINEMFSVFGGDLDFSTLNRVTSGRMAIYKHMISLFLDNKWFGVGWQNFADYSFARSSSGGINQGHNVFLQLLCETGLVGFSIITLLYLSYLFEISKKLKIHVNNKGKVDSKGRIYISDESNLKIALGIIILFFLFWLSGNPLYDAIYLYTFVIGLLIGTVKPTVELTG